MRLRYVFPVVGMSLAAVLVQVVAALGGAWAAILVAIGVGLSIVPLSRVVAAEDVPVWLTISAPGIATASGVAIAFGGGLPLTPVAWLAPVAAAGTAAAVAGFRLANTKRCALCECRIGGGVAFNCPRCGLLVCEQKCWTFEHLRCRLCLEHRVPVLPQDARWWDKHTGPRTSFGRCQLCMASAAEADLRPCGRCMRPQCRDCWDENNGQCARCRWTIEDLPAALKEYVASAPAEPGR